MTDYKHDAHFSWEAQRDMDHTGESLLKAFSEACPLHSSLRTEDWERLYQFTLHIHRGGQNTHYRTILSYLLRHGWRLRKAIWLSTEYRHFSELLALYDEQKTS
jgi:hypothetical protein